MPVMNARNFLSLLALVSLNPLVPAILAQDGSGEHAYTEAARISEFNRGDILVLPNDLMFANDGRLLIIDEGTSKVLALDRTLSVVGSFGAKGEGPEEFQRPGPIGHNMAGGYAVWDRVTTRLTVLTPKLELRSSRAYPIDFRHHGFVQELVQLGDEEFVIASTTWPMFGYNEVSRTRVLRVDRDGVEAELSSHPGYDVLSNMEDPLFVSVVRQPYGSETRVHFERDGEHYWVGSTRGNVLTRYATADGRVVGAVRFAYSGPPVTKADRDAFAAAQHEQLEKALAGTEGEQSKRLRERFTWIRNNVEFPPRKPAWEDFALDESGRIWLRLTGRSAIGPRHWVWLSPAGEVLGEFEVPHRGEIFASAVDRGRILTTEQNDLDLWELVEYTGPRETRAENAVQGGP
jgi:hypothetical protein